MLGFLAKHPRYQTRLMEGSHKVDPNLGVRVVAFSRQETDVKFGIWGSIADQLGKSNQFQECYAPLKATARRCRRPTGRAAARFYNEKRNGACSAKAGNFLEPF